MQLQSKQFLGIQILYSKLSNIKALRRSVPQELPQEQLNKGSIA